MTSPFQLLCFTDQVDWEGILGSYLEAFEPGDPVTLVLAGPDEGTGAELADRVLAAIAGLGHEPERIPDVEVTPFAPAFRERLRAGSSCELTAPRTVPELRALLGPAACEAGADLTSIILLGFNQQAYTQLCLASIARHTPEPHELILVDNGSTDGTREYFTELARRHPHVTAILNDTNLGFAAGCNQGLRVARGRRLLLLNNDTLVSAGWLRRLVDRLESEPEIGIVGPVSNYVDGPQLVPDVPYGFDQDDIERFADEWARRHAGQGFEHDRVVGFCLLFAREVLDRIGGLDPRFGNGNFEDDDFCLRARTAGFRIWVCQDVFIHHYGSRTFKQMGGNAGYRSAMDLGWERFKGKWGLPPELSRREGYDLPGLARRPFDRVRSYTPLWATPPATGG